MRFLYYTVISVYFLAVNLYSIIVINRQKQNFDEGEQVNDGNIVLSGFLGGAISIYTFMLIKKYRLSNLFLMVAMPVLSAVSGFILYYLFTVRI